MAALPYFPHLLLREMTVAWELMGTLISGGQTLAGAMPAVKLDGGGLWKAALADISLHTKDHIRTWRALAAICDGGAQPIVVEMCDRRYFPAPTVSGSYVYSLGSVPHSDDAAFSDDTEYESDTVEIKVTAAAELRATSLTVEVVAGGDLMGGEHFSIDHPDLRWRLYRVRTAIDNGDGTWGITIRPPLRAAVSAPTPLQFDRPKCVMRLAAAGAMDLVLEGRQRGRPTVNFLEAFPPYPA